MDVLVTGATGYLGGHVAARLAAAGHVVRALVRPSRDTQWLEAEGVRCYEGDLLDERSLHNALRGAEGLVHCAARLGYWSRQDEEQRRVNVEGSSTLYRATARRGVRRVVHVSTVGTVGARRVPEPMSEDEPWGGQERPRAMYFSSKREAEERALAAAKGGLELCVVNPGMMLGRRADGQPTGGMIAALLDGRVKAVPPGGGTVADVTDVAAGCVAALERGARGRRYLLGGHNLTWLELYRAIADAAGVTPPARERSALSGRLLALGASGLDLLRLSRPPWAPERYRLWGWFGHVDSSRAAEELGYRFRPLDEIVARAVDAARPAPATMGA